jgi:hypothetical protein
MQSKTILAAAAFMALHTLAGAQDKSSEKDVLTIYKGSHTYKEVSVDGKTTEVYVDDNRVADGEVPHYDSLIQVMRADVNDDDRRFGRMDEKMDRDEERTERERERAQGQRERVQEQAERNQERAERDREREQEHAERDRERAQEQRERDQEQAQRDREQAQIDREQGERDRAKAEQDMAAMRDLIQVLVNKKVVSDPEHVSSLVLTDTALYVNGVKQPNELHQSIKGKYSDWAHYGLSYGNSQAPTTFIHIDLPGGCCQ